LRVSSMVQVRSMISSSPYISVPSPWSSSFLGKCSEPHPQGAYCTTTSPATPPKPALSPPKGRGLEAFSKAFPESSLRQASQSIPPIPPAVEWQNRRACAAVGCKPQDVGGKGGRGDTPRTPRVFAAQAPDDQSSSRATRLGFEHCSRTTTSVAGRIGQQRGSVVKYGSERKKERGSGSCL